MKYAYTNWKLYIVSAALTVISFVAIILPHCLMKYVFDGASGYNYDYAIFGIAAALFLIGFVIADLYQANYRRKSKNWDGKLPGEIRNRAWSYRMPFFSTCGVLILFGLFLEIYRASVGVLPF